MIAIPWTAVRITHQGRAPVVADPCTGIFYNPNTCYVAEQLLDDQPERTVFIVPDEQTLRACLSEIDERWADEDPSRPMRFGDGPIDAATFIELRRLVEILSRNDADALAAHEMTIAIVARLIAQSYRSRGQGADARGRASKRTLTQQREIADGAQEVCLRQFNQPLGLEQIAQAVGASRFHLCRLFRTFTGRSIHQYLTELRLRASLDGVCDARSSLAQVALAAGFSSQSHFTTAFVRQFRRTPAAFRREVGRGQIKSPIRWLSSDD